MNKSNSNPTMVFGLGPARTGTDSLRSALTELGFGPTYHMKELILEESGISTEGHMQQWIDAAIGEAIDWQNLLGKDWRSGVDFPLSTFPKELHAAFPDAKFILTRRPAKDWYKSINNTICTVTTERYPTKFLQYLPYEPHLRWKDHTIMSDLFIRHKFAPGLADSLTELCSSEEIAIRAFNEWYRQIEEGELVPLDQLLVLELGKHGYRELSEFLGVEEPTSPYPRINSTREMQSAIRFMWFYMIMVIVLFVLVLGSVVFMIRKVVAGQRSQETKMHPSKKRD